MNNNIKSQIYQYEKIISDNNKGLYKYDVELITTVRDVICFFMLFLLMSTLIDIPVFMFSYLVLLVGVFSFVGILASLKNNNEKTSFYRLIKFNIIAVILTVFYRILLEHLANFQIISIEMSSIIFTNSVLLFLNMKINYLKKNKNKNKIQESLTYLKNEIVKIDVTKYELISLRHYCEEHKYKDSETIIRKLIKEKDYKKIKNFELKKAKRVKRSKNNIYVKF